ncbi:hypothetical protein HO173_008432 [Letharia columbiana]|uniref:F-box domain-containing protein n=1 Tax=Letharia columbiana TaxID=112416 RepID=A0A8H6FRN7_9LECA|nr:uncharacterized protein HO173_008432 [Letharia columbiana]KAF6233500.1 hypothetical protein HO173_008432 [Letharia columbiana]
MAPVVLNDVAMFDFDPTAVPHLPAEVLNVVVAFMDIATIKATRLTSRFMADALAPFVLDKVWISPAKEDQTKLREISQHPTARLIVREIAYDSTVYCGSLFKLSDYMKVCHLCDFFLFGTSVRLARLVLQAGKGHLP